MRVCKGRDSSSDREESLLTLAQVLGKRSMKLKLQFKYRGLNDYTVYDITTEIPNSHYGGRKITTCLQFHTGVNYGL